MLELDSVDRMYAFLFCFTLTNRVVIQPTLFLSMSINKMSIFSTLQTSAMLLMFPLPDVSIFFLFSEKEN